MQNNNYYTNEEIDLFGKIHLCFKINESFDSFMKKPWAILEQIAKESKPLLATQLKNKSDLNAQCAKEENQKECNKQEINRPVQLTLGFPDEY